MDAAAAVGVARFGGGYVGAVAGEWIADKLVPEKLTVTGMISSASFNVFINDKARGSARASPTYDMLKQRLSLIDPTRYAYDPVGTLTGAWNQTMQRLLLPYRSIRHAARIEQCSRPTGVAGEL